MSRIANVAIAIPSGVAVQIENGTVTAKGPKGEESFDLTPGITVAEENGALSVRIDQAARSGRADKHIRAMSGTTRAMVNNLVVGVSAGFERRLNILGVGYRAQAQGNRLNLNLGFSHPVVYQLPAGVSVETPSQTEIVLRGTNKQVVGQTAAEIRAFRPPEPYKGKGVRYADEYVLRKQARKK